MLTDKKGKPTKKPIRRIFQIFEDVTVLYDEYGREQLELMNLGETAKEILSLFSV